MAQLVGRDTPAAVVAVVLCVALVLATWFRGAFFEPQSSIMLGVSLVLVAVVISGFEATVLRREDVCLLALSIWWLVSAELHHVPRNFLPLGASLAAILAGSIGTRTLGSRARRTVNACIVAVGSLTGLVGLIACDVRWYPVAMRGQNLWRLAGTLTYSNAAGLLIAMAIVLSLGTKSPALWRILSLELCSAGLVASGSRGAMVAAAVAALVLLRSYLVGAAVPLAAGICAGMVTIASSRGPAAAIPALVVACLILVAGCAWSLWRAKEPRRRIALTHRAWKFAAGVGAVLALGSIVIVARTEIATRIGSGSIHARFAEWRLALQQFRSSPFIGAGPDKVLIPQTSGVASYFAHNEYLQVLAGAGVVGAFLLLATLILSGQRLWLDSKHEYGPVSAIVVFALGGLFDYSWHLPALGLCAGIALGLATPLRGGSGINHLAERRDVLAVSRS